MFPKYQEMLSILKMFPIPREISGLGIPNSERRKEGEMRTLSALFSVFVLSMMGGCATTEYQPYEAKNNVFEGKGGTKVVVDGMELWDDGDPRREFKVLGIINDERPGGIIPMSQLRGDMVKKAKEVGGDAVVQLSSQ